MNAECGGRRGGPQLVTALQQYLAMTALAVPYAGGTAFSDSDATPTTTRSPTPTLEIMLAGSGSVTKGVNFSFVSIRVKCGVSRNKKENTSDFFFFDVNRSQYVY